MKYMVNRWSWGRPTTGDAIFLSWSSWQLFSHPSEKPQVTFLRGNHSKWFCKSLMPARNITRLEWYFLSKKRYLMWNLFSSCLLFIYYIYNIACVYIYLYICRYTHRHTYTPTLPKSRKWQMHIQETRTAVQTEVSESDSFKEHRKHWGCALNQMLTFLEKISARSLPSWLSQVPPVSTQMSPFREVLPDHPI